MIQIAKIFLIYLNLPKVRKWRWKIDCLIRIQIKTIKFYIKYTLNQLNLFIFYLVIVHGPCTPIINPLLIVHGPCTSMYKVYGTKIVYGHVFYPVFENATSLMAGCIAIATFFFGASHMFNLQCDNFMVESHKIRLNLPEIGYNSRNKAMDIILLIIPAFNCKNH